MTLSSLRIKNVNKLIIGHLNINSLSSKFEQLKELVTNNIDILVLTETKLDASFPTEQFLINGFSKPYRSDRNRQGGGVMIYTREDIPTKELKRHNFNEEIEGIFLEINLRKVRWLILGTLSSTNSI